MVENRNREISTNRTPTRWELNDVKERISKKASFKVTLRLNRHYTVVVLDNKRIHKLYGNIECKVITLAFKQTDLAS